ncbi:MAG: response regulator [Elusimicrobiales bacterium]|nr:response regulator [Elusimicrobiales bacterium]
MSKILIVDDDQNNRALLENTFSEAGHKIISAASGREGLQKAGPESPDIIVAGTSLPELAGFIFSGNKQAYPRVISTQMRPPRSLYISRNIPTQEPEDTRGRRRFFTGTAAFQIPSS